MTDLLMTASAERLARKQVNTELHTLTNRYHDGLALGEIDAILIRNGFTGLADAIYCGRDGQSHEQVGRRTWFTMTWHKMDSGRYEIVAYVN